MSNPLDRPTDKDEHRHADSASSGAAQYVNDHLQALEDTLSRANRRGKHSLVVPNHDRLLADVEFSDAEVATLINPKRLQALLDSSDEFLTYFNAQAIESAETMADAMSDKNA